MNKNFKRIAALLLAIAMIASFAACKKDKDNNDTTAAGDVAINGDAIADDLLPEASSEATSDDTAVETEIVTDKEGHTVIETKAPADNSAKPSNGKPRAMPRSSPLTETFSISQRAARSAMRSPSGRPCPRTRETLTALLSTRLFPLPSCS